MRSAPLILAVAVLAACDLPTDAAGARDHLDRDGDAPVVLRVPMPPVDVLLLEEFSRAAGFSGHIGADGWITVNTPEVQVATSPADASGARSVTHSLTLPSGALGDGAGLLADVRLAQVELEVEVRNAGTVGFDVAEARLTVLDAAGGAAGGGEGSGGGMSLDLAAALGRAHVAPRQRVSGSVAAVELGNEILERLRQGPVQLRVDGSLSAAGATPLDVAVQVRLHAPLDVEVGAGLPVEYRAHGVNAAALLQAASVLRVADRPARLELDIENEAALGARVTVALAPTPADTAGFDPFDAAGRILLDDVNIAAAGAAPGRGTGRIALDEALLAPFDGRDVTAAIRVTLLPGANGRVALQPGRRLRVRPVAVIGDTP